MAVSVIVIRSAVQGDPSLTTAPLKQLVFYAMGFVILFIVPLINYQWLLKFWYLIYAGGLALIVGVYKFGIVLNGAYGWYKIGSSLSLQPAELEKLVLIITLAFLLSRRKGEPLQLVQDIMPIFVLSVIPFAAVVLMPDLGNAVIYVIIVVGMLWIGNVKYTHVLIGIGVLAAASAAVVYAFNAYNEAVQNFFIGIGKKHWYERIQTFLHPDQVDALDQGYQVNGSMRAIGSGGMWGDGYMQGESARNVTYTYSDSIFAVVGEEWGFVGSAVLLVLYFALIYRMILIALACVDKRGSYIIIGVVSMYAFQIFQNIGMSIGLMPITGITLPFVSYGGTSLLINMMCIGLVFSVAAYQESYAQQQGLVNQGQAM
jgi:rod shape determining protein RodA